MYHWWMERYRANMIAVYRMVLLGWINLSIRWDVPQFVWNESVGRIRITRVYKILHFVTDHRREHGEHTDYSSCECGLLA